MCLDPNATLKLLKSLGPNAALVKATTHTNASATVRKIRERMRSEKTMGKVRSGMVILM